MSRLLLLGLLGITQALRNIFRHGSITGTNLGADFHAVEEDEFNLASEFNTLWLDLNL